MICVISDKVLTYNLGCHFRSTVSPALLSPQDRESLLAAAREALKRAHAPYSNFHVGAAVLTDQGEMFSGCNVENASYGLTNCAERSAIFTAVQGTKAAKLKIRAVAVVNGNNVPCSPCGACRQVIAEFGENALVIFQGQKDYIEMSIQDLLPESFRLS
jgi:cytidine deaminase